MVRQARPTHPRRNDIDREFQEYSCGKQAHSVEKTEVYRQMKKFREIALLYDVFVKEVDITEFFVYITLARHSVAITHWGVY